MQGRILSARKKKAMNKELPKRKKIRLENYDYSSAGAYFVTVCTQNRKKLFWKDNTNVGADIIRPKEETLSSAGEIVDNAINQISDHYENILVDKYCIMPDHIHLIIFIMSDESGRIISAPTLQTVVGQMKRYVSKELGFPVWQKSFVDRVIRNDAGYRKIWEYIDNNPIKMDYAYDNIDFSEF